MEANANNYTLPDASASVKGGVTVGTNVDVSGGKISVKNGTTNQKGVVQLSSATDDTNVTGNSWSVAFTSLSGVVVTGVWNESQGRIEF